MTYSHQPGSMPVDVPEVVPNPVYEPQRTPASPERTPVKEPVRVPEKVPSNIALGAIPRRSFLPNLVHTPAPRELLFCPADHRARPSA